jgi:Na+/H+ antiporter NhaA
MAGVSWASRLAAVTRSAWSVYRSTSDPRARINDGLMAFFFFFVVGLEIRREFDMGELRDHRRVAIPVLAALGGMAAPALIYLAFNAGAPAARGWGIVMATDTAFALGALALIGRRFPTRLRVFLLTLVIVDDIGALTVIALGYTQELSPVALLVAVGLFGVVLGLRQLGVRRGIPYVVVGVGVWLATLESGIHPTIAGVALGLLATAYPPSRQDLQRAMSLWRTFREQPTPRFARSARLGVTEAISPNERLQDPFQTWTSYLVVPLFALANAGVELRGDLLGRALASPITLGIVFGLVAGKPIGITGASWLASRGRLGGFPLTVAWPPLVGLATLAGIGFTVSLFVADLSFQGEQLEEAKVGILAASVLATSLGWLAFRLKHLLPAWVLAAAQARAAEPLMDLADPVDPERDHVRGPEDGPVTLVEYGDFQCPHCGRVEPVVRELLAEFGDDLRYVFRHLPSKRCTRTPRWRRRPRRRRGPRGRSGRCTSSCSPTRTPSTSRTCTATPRSWGSTSAASRRSFGPAPMPPGWPATWRAPIGAGSPAPPRSSSTGADTTAPMTSTRSRVSSAPRWPSRWGDVRSRQSHEGEQIARCPLRVLVGCRDEEIGGEDKQASSSRPSTWGVGARREGFEPPTARPDDQPGDQASQASLPSRSMLRLTDGLGCIPENGRHTWSNAVAISLTFWISRLVVGMRRNP